MENRDFWRGITYCVLAALAWAFIGPFSRLCFAEGIAPTAVAFWRLAISGVCFLIHALVFHELKTTRRDFCIMALFGAFVVATIILTLQISIQKSGSALAIILMFTAPIWVALFSRILFHEVITPAKLAAILLALMGTLLVCFSGGSLGEEVSYIGLSAGLVCGFSYAFQFLFFAWWKDRYATAVLFAMTFLPAAAVLSFFADFQPVSMVGALALVCPSILSTYAAYYWYGQSLRYITPVQAAIVGNLEPVVGTFLSWWLWDENFSLIGWMGCVCVIGSVLLLTLRK